MQMCEIKMKMRSNKFFAFGLFILLAFLAGPFAVLGQNIAINTSGTAPVNSAKLDISSTNKGILIPRVSLVSNTDVATVPSPATSLLVYNSNASMTNGNGTGYYYWNGSKWAPVTMSSTSSGACRPTMETNELTSAGAPCVGTACGNTMDSRTCAVNCDNLVYNGYSDWRVPTCEEVINLISVAPSNTSANQVWTSTKSTGAFPGGYYVAIVFSTLQDNQILYSSSTDTYCRCVR